MGLQKPRVHQPGGVFTRLGVLNFVVQDCPEQHRVEEAGFGLTPDRRGETFDFF